MTSFAAIWLSVVETDRLYFYTEIADC